MSIIKSAAVAAVLAALCLPAMAGKLHSSIQVTDATTSPKKVAESQEELNTPRLLKLARITKEQAKAIAAKKFKGKFGKIDLENEDGDLIWSVEIGRQELAIDAGTGKILQVE